MPRNDTEPYEQLLTKEEVELARKVRECGQRYKERRDDHATRDSMDNRPERPARDYAPELTEFSHREDSMPIVRFLLSFISDSVEQTKGYRLTISLAISVLILLTIASYGGFERFGVTGFARADVIKSKIEDATKPLEREIAKQTQLLNEVAKQLTNRLASDTATQIRSKLERLCAEPKPPKSDRDQLNHDIAELQDQYFDLKLSPYVPPPCSQL